MARIRSEDIPVEQDKIEYPVGGDAEAPPEDYRGRAIETEGMSMADVDLEALLNEKCVITIQRPSGDTRVGQLLCVNGETQPVRYNEPTKVKLKFVGSLIDAKTAEYDQEPSHTWDVTESKISGQITRSYPFSLDDATPKARAWVGRRMRLPG